jgi:hypothetical protein
VALLTTLLSAHDTPRIFAACLVSVVLVGCYQPAIRDCTVTCEGQGDCASGQVCGTDGFCASPELAGHCAALRVPDARERADARPGAADAKPGAADARPETPDAKPTPDAPPPPDAMPITGTLHVAIAGRGQVTVAPIAMTCTSPNKNGATCDLAIPIGVALSLSAIATHPNEPFQGWGGACAGQGAICGITAGPGTTQVSVQFAKNGGGGDD